MAATNREHRPHFRHAGREHDHGGKLLLEGGVVFVEVAGEGVDEYPGGLKGLPQFLHETLCEAGGVAHRPLGTDVTTPRGLLTRADDILRTRDFGFGEQVGQ
jgi:hypothetical protein